jgi:hypothetical protein
VPTDGTTAPGEPTCAHPPRAPRRLNLFVTVPPLLLPILLAVPAACGNATRTDPCKPGDSDGIIGGNFTFDVGVTDTSFSPTILKAQNLANVTLSLTNTGTKPHDFAMDCLPTPNANGCPSRSCFADTARIGPVAPHASAKATFTTPNPQGIYIFRSDLPGDTQATGDGGTTGLIGYFIVQ